MREKWKRGDSSLGRARLDPQTHERRLQRRRAAYEASQTTPKNEESRTEVDETEVAAPIGVSDERAIVERLFAQREGSESAWKSQSLIEAMRES